MDSSVSPKDEIWFLRVCHHISNAVYLQMVSSREYRATQEAGYGGFTSVYCVSVPTTRRYASTLSWGRFPHVKLEPVSITGYGSCLPRSGRRSCIQGVLTGQELRAKVTTTSRKGSDNSPHSTYESSQIWEAKCLLVYMYIQISWMLSRYY